MKRWESYRVWKISCELVPIYQPNGMRKVFLYNYPWNQELNFTGQQDLVNFVILLEEFLKVDSNRWS